MVVEGRTVRIRVVFFVAPFPDGEAEQAEHADLVFLQHHEERFDTIWLKTAAILTSRPCSSLPALCGATQNSSQNVFGGRSTKYERTSSNNQTRYSILIHAFLLDESLRLLRQVWGRAFRRATGRTRAVQRAPAILGSPAQFHL